MIFLRVYLNVNLCSVIPTIKGVTLKKPNFFTDLIYYMYICIH